MNKDITHKAYTWAIEFNKYIKNILKGKTKEEREEQLKKLLDEKDKKIEELKTVLDKRDKSICVDIEREDNPKRCFLIIGDDEDLIEGISTYIFCFYLNKGKLFFNAEDFTGNDDKTIKEKLIYQGDCNTWLMQCSFLTNPSYLKLIDLMDEIEASRRDLLLYFQYGGTLFLRNLKSQDCEMLKSIAMKIRNIVTKNADSHGTLLVSTDSKDNLSDYFTNQFTIISPKSKKQDEAVNTSLKPRATKHGFGDPLETERHDSGRNNTEIATGNEKNITKVFYDDAKGVLFLSNKYWKLEGHIKILIEFLIKDRRSVEEVIEHFQFQYTNNSWQRGNFDTLTFRTNKKCKEQLGIEKLIKNKERGICEYCLSVVVVGKNFEKRM